MRLTWENRSSQRKTYPSASLFTKNPIWTGTGLNSGPLADSYWHTSPHITRIGPTKGKQQLQRVRKHAFMSENVQEDTNGNLGID